AIDARIDRVPVRGRIDGHGRGRGGEGARKRGSRQKRGDTERGCGSRHGPLQLANAMIAPRRTPRPKVISGSERPVSRLWTFRSSAAQASLQVELRIRLCLARSQSGGWNSPISIGEKGINTARLRDNFVIDNFHNEIIAYDARRSDRAHPIATQPL